MQIALTVNGSLHMMDVDPRQRLSGFLRETLDLTGLKEGCVEGECGACTVLLDGRPANSCLMLAFQANGRRITTIEGLHCGDAAMTSLQQAFIDHGAIQCGYCTPGMVLVAEAFLRENPNPSDAEIRSALAGNICRCSGYESIVRAIRSEARRRAAKQVA